MPFNLLGGGGKRRGAKAKQACTFTALPMYSESPTNSTLSTTGS